MQVVVHVLLWNERFVPLHWTHEGLPKRGGPLWCSPLVAPATQPPSISAHGFVDQHVGLDRIGGAPHREIDKVHTHEVTMSRACPRKPPMTAPLASGLGISLRFHR
jgi:hypothetical protein